MRRAIGICAAVILFFSGLYLLLYPYAMGEKLDEQSGLAVESFIQTHAAEKAPEAEIPYPELYAAIKSYNDTIYLEKQAGLSNPSDYSTPSFDLSEYGIEDGIIAETFFFTQDHAGIGHTGDSCGTGHVVEDIAAVMLFTVVVDKKNAHLVIVGNLLQR